MSQIIVTWMDTLHQYSHLSSLVSRDRRRHYARAQTVRSTEFTYKLMLKTDHQFNTSV